MDLINNMEYGDYKKLKEKVEGLRDSVKESADAGLENAKAFADKAEAKLNEVPSEVQAGIKDKYEQFNESIVKESNAKYILIAGVALVVVAVVLGVFIG